MSLVNEVLRDLQAREGDSRFRLRDLKPAEWGRQGSLARQIGPPVLALLVVVPAFFAWQWLSAHRSPMAPARYELRELVLPPRVESRRVTLDSRGAVAVSPAGRPRHDAPPQAAPAEENRPAPPPEEVTTAAVELSLSQRGGPPAEKHPTEAREVPESTALVKRTVTDPKTIAARALALGREAGRRGDFESAERQFQAAVTAHPRDGVAWSHLYAALRKQGKTEAASAAAAEGLQKATDPAPLAAHHARALITQGDLAPALDLLRSHRPAQKSADYDALLAWLLQRNGLHGEAAEIYAELLSVRPTAGDWWVGLAISLESLGRRSEALRAFEQAQSGNGLKAPLADYARNRIAALRQEGSQ